LNKAPDAAPPMAGSALPGGEPAEPNPKAAAEKTPRDARTTPAMAKPSFPTGSANLPVPTARLGSSPPPRADPSRTVPETPPEEPAVANSSVIFYAGVGIAAVVLLLSFAAFKRGGKDDASRGA